MPRTATHAHLLAALGAADEQRQSALRACQADGAAILLAVREQLGLRQADLAERLELSPTYLCKIERGHMPAGAPLLLKLAEMLKNGEQPGEK